MDEDGHVFMKAIKASSCSLGFFPPPQINTTFSTIMSRSANNYLQNKRILFILLLSVRSVLFLREMKKGRPVKMAFKTKNNIFIYFFG